MSVLFEVEHRGEHLVGFGLPAEGEPLRLRRIGLAELHDAVTSGRGLGEHLAEGAEEVVAPANEVRFLPPLLPSHTGNSLISGFMSTHRSKYDRAPEPDEPFSAPRWLIKGMGSWLRVSGDPLVVPASTTTLLEEPEIAVVFVNDEHGVPHYAGHSFGNDLNDIGLHLRNPWGWTPYSKLCDTSISPFLFPTDPPETATGTTTITRDGEVFWRGPFSCGGDSLFQRIPDMLDNLLSYPALRRPHLVNYVLLGADKASFHEGSFIADGDTLTLDFTSHGVTLSNPVRYAEKV
ncbi:MULTISPECIES: hypothetical protein [Actinosynnema]|uniref:hypothetical protein n=1 Tax=Actinosynnema TaxID=40566 RepID=UPI0020A314FA|nr:hypothetical protein [Actinosynnema pretiosum]MCP2092332.1 Fumarylacetoacetate (FAA) hydrolase family [Actinosynnema pretiosum]